MFRRKFIALNAYGIKEKISKNQYFSLSQEIRKKREN